jgi:RNA polymerase sigma factor (sigma-70 family)
VAHADQVLADLAKDRRRDLTAYAALFTGDLAAAEDLVQDALIKVFGRLRTGFSPDVAEAYVRRTIATLYIDSFRRWRRWKAAAPMLAVDDSEDPGDLAGQLDLQAALATLGPQERTCVVLRYYSDLTVPEIAAQMGLAEGTVKRYLSNALHRLEARLGTIEPDLSDSVDILPILEGKP